MVLPIIFFVIVLCLSFQIEAQLQVGFYKNTCPDAESIVREEVKEAYDGNKGIAPGLIRLHFHDCFVRGCDSSIFIDSTPGNVAEKDGLPNGISLRGLEVIDSAKARLEDECEGVVSCADILAFAARDSAVIMGGMYWNVPAGRRDGRISRAEETLVDIPAPFFNLDQLTQSFAKKGLTQKEMVALSGAHTSGRSHCTSFTNRLYNFSQTDKQDPILNTVYASQLKDECPKGVEESIDPNLVVDMNISPTFLDNSYYADVIEHRGLFTSDESLLNDTDTASLVKLYALINLKWQRDFVQAMIKMSQIEVLTGSAGEIRSNCRVINK